MLPTSHHLMPRSPPQPPSPRPPVHGAGPAGADVHLVQGPAAALWRHQQRRQRPQVRGQEGELRGGRAAGERQGSDRQVRGSGRCVLQAGAASCCLLGAVLACAAGRRRRPAAGRPRGPAAEARPLRRGGSCCPWPAARTARARQPGSQPSSHPAIHSASQTASQAARARQAARQAGSQPGCAPRPPRPPGSGAWAELLRASRASRCWWPAGSWRPPSRPPAAAGGSRGACVEGLP
jgi:hypothetical protein